MGWQYACDILQCHRVSYKRDFKEHLVQPPYFPHERMRPRKRRMYSGLHDTTVVGAVARTSVSVAIPTPVPGQDSTGPGQGLRPRSGSGQ